MANLEPSRFSELRFVALPSAILVIFFPLALASMRDLAPRLAAGLVLFVAGYFICVYHLNLLYDSRP